MATLATFTFLVTGTEESREALLSLGITRREMQKMLLTVWMVKLSMEGKLESLWQNMIVPLKTWLPAVEVEDVLTEAAEEEVEDMGVPLHEEAIVMGVDMNAVIAIREDRIHDRDQDLMAEEVVQGHPSIPQEDVLLLLEDPSLPEEDPCPQEEGLILLVVIAIDQEVGHPTAAHQKAEAQVKVLVNDVTP